MNNKPTAATKKATRAYFASRVARRNLALALAAELASGKQLEPLARALDLAGSTCRSILKAEGL